MHAPHALHLEALHVEDVHASDALLAMLTFCFGAVGLGLVAGDAMQAGAVCGAAGVVTGLWGQMVSRTTSERFLDVIGLVAAALALAIGAITG